ncbi:lipopolysaccharide biosynthesis protein [Streptomyces leeuwenhoekii]|uniref:Lipopolysaccharide biosynthesis protein n=1 Tax=Streptomyces leeuwenhoekii TaxID=1437453 RepID=A0A0F7VYC0_STRLW|nr:lipopolysaccharide biosynthesis protein [Streptomyces leeuwenhoekii]CQR62512.1 Conserved Hypothetical Protein [Streptomyces leeuwenhoekii]
MAETRAREAAALADGGPKAPAGGPAAESLFKNAYFLMLSTGVSAVLGLGFWLVAARYYSEEAVGQGSAAIAAMRLLAGITATTMIGAVVRFVPRAGRATASLVWRTYAASSAVVVLAALVFLLTLDLWGASYAPLGTPAAGAVFVAACAAWALLTLQDGVLTGLRKAEWVPAGNAVFSVGKLVLLALFAGTLPVLGVFVSWAVAIAFSTLPLGWLVFRRLVPRQAAADRDLEPPGIREVGRFLAGDSLGALFSLAMINLLPVMVAVRFSAAENGYFYVAYTVGGTMEFMAMNMASSLTAHASHDPRRLADGVRGALRRMTLLLVPVVLVLVVLAPRILAPFDADYAEHGSAVLRLLALGALPRVAVELYIGVLRVQGRTGALAVVQGAMCVLVLGSAAVLFTPAGIAGAGWAVLLGMTVVAAGCAPGLRSALRGDDGGGSGGPGRLPRGRERAPAYGTRWARLNATAGYGTDWARRAAYERGGADEDPAALFTGRPGHEREAPQADPPALIVRPHRPGTHADADDRAHARARYRADDRAHARARYRADDRAQAGAGTESGTGAGRAGSRERWPTAALWCVLGVTTAVFWASLRGLPWLGGAPPGSGTGPTGRRLLEGLPLPALVAGGLLLMVFVASVTLRAARDAWLPGAALASVLTALHAAPVALGWEPVPVGGAGYSAVAGVLAEAAGLDGPGPLLRWVPPAAGLLCLAPLGLLLARAAGRLTWPGLWGVLYVVALGGWVWRDALAPAAVPLLALLALVAVLLPLVRALPPPGRSRPTGPGG